MTMATRPTSEGLAAALEYARANWPLLPLDDGLSPFSHEPTHDAEMLVRLWSARPDAHPGVVLGRSIGTTRLQLVALVDHCTATSSAYLEKWGVKDALGLGHLMCGATRAWLFVTQDPLPSRELAPGLEVRGEGVFALPPANTIRGQWRWRKNQFFAERPLIAAPHWLRIAEPEFPSTPEEPSISQDWIAEIARSKQGKVTASLANAALILRCDDRYAGRIAYDEMTLSVSRDHHALGDADIATMREQIERRYGVAFADRTTRDALLIVADPRRYHPVRAYLQGLRWDGVARLDHVASEILGATQALAPSMLRKFFLAAVARSLDPGCKVDNALVLVGDQGALKSTFFRVLASPWFSDTHLDPTNKDALQQIAAAWIYELGEIDSITSRKHASDLKRFMTSASDAFRPPYERSIRIVPRSGVMVGTTNRDRFLTDETGSRRFWVVRVPDRIHISLLTRERDQLWAEAVVAQGKKESWWLSDAEEIVRENDAEQHGEQDPWRPLVARHFQTQFRQQQLRADYTCAELAADVLKVEKRDLNRNTEMRLGDVLKSLGLSRRKVRIERDGRRLDPTWTWVWPDQEPEWLHTEIAAAQTAQEAGFV